MWKEKFGNYLIDISKYVLTGVVISSLFKYLGGNKFFIYGIGFIFSIVALMSGLVLTNKKERRTNNGRFISICWSWNTLFDIFNFLPHS